MNHLIEILTGSANEKIQRWGHDKLTTYGIGKDLTRPQWSAIGRDLLRLGYLAQDAGQFPTIALTDLGLDALKSRRVIMLSKPVELKKINIPRTGEIECDETLFDRLRKLRKRLADERGVPAYVIFGDNTLRQMAREYPTHIDALRMIGGMGEKKLAEFGNVFTNEVATYLQTYPKVDFGGHGE
jgi:ATP-dependent DNA helicase RecQ